MLGYNEIRLYKIREFIIIYVISDEVCKRGSYRNLCPPIVYSLHAINIDMILHLPSLPYFNEYLFASNVCIGG